MFESKKDLFAVTTKERLSFIQIEDIVKQNANKITLML